jgi:hypothetical protein
LVKQIKTWKKWSAEALPVDDVCGTQFLVEGLGIWKIYQKSLELCAQNWRFALSFSGLNIRKFYKKSLYTMASVSGNCGLV